MALVTSLEEIKKDRQSVHNPTRCLVSILESGDGSRYLQLDTLGSNSREIPDKVSQTIQFDRQAAGQLLQFIHRAFPGIFADGDDSPPVDAQRSSESEEDGEEGRILLRIHRQKERNRRLVALKKRQAFDSTGRLTCEACGFDFATVYGSLGEGFAECHHRSPLSELTEVTRTRLSDLAIVCANCHRMLHRQPVHTVEEIRDLIAACRQAAN